MLNVIKVLPAIFPSKCPFSVPFGRSYAIGQPGIWLPFSLDSRQTGGIRMSAIPHCGLPTAFVRSVAPDNGLPAPKGHRPRRVLCRQRPPGSLLLSRGLRHVARRLCGAGDRPTRSRLLRCAARQDPVRAHHASARRQCDCRARRRHGDGVKRHRAVGRRRPRRLARNHESRRRQRR